METNSTLTPWDFFEVYKYHDWNKLTVEILNKLVIAILIILEDLGKISPSIEIIKLNLDKGTKILNILLNK